MVMTTYLDASAIVKILLREADAERAHWLWRTAERRATSVVAYVEARAAIAAAVKEGRVASTTVDARRYQLDRRWRQCQPVALDDHLLRLAGRVADDEGLRALDAIHLATALYLGVARTVFVPSAPEIVATACAVCALQAPKVPVPGSSAMDATVEYVSVSVESTDTLVELVEAEPTRPIWTVPEGADVSERTR